MVLAVLGAAEVPLPPEDLHARVEDPKARGPRIDQPGPAVASTPQVVDVHEHLRVVRQAGRIRANLGALQFEDKLLGRNALRKHAVDVFANAIDLDYSVLLPHVPAFELLVPVSDHAWLQALDDEAHPIAVVDIYPELPALCPVYDDRALLLRSCLQNVALLLREDDVVIRVISALRCMQKVALLLRKDDVVIRLIRLPGRGRGQALRSVHRVHLWWA
mmetsp:Transcript_62286/g.166541  ORF Transcript_62286/g.166541 Transcript_62286/m.166541 type:complete len:218 (+) Transcript_62286:625-1278(+)